VTRAGRPTPFWWGPFDYISPQRARYREVGLPKTKMILSPPVPVDSFEANPWGLFNVHGNVWEWTEDCWNDSNKGNPGNGNARTAGDCSQHVVRGGSWDENPRALRAASRNGVTPDSQLNEIGFRLARTLSP
jgi:formylglycine-generating enzyme required for sulfatase activity